MANDYDISEAFQTVEEEMINSMIRNMKRHINTEKIEGLNYAQWQAEQLAALQEYRNRNAKEFGNYFSTINTQIDEALKQCYKNGNMDQEIAILEAMKKGFTPPKVGMIGATYGDFFKINDRKMNALLKATRRDMQRAETAMLRMANDQYRKTIFNAGVYYESGAGTLEKAVDMATKDYLSSGLNCIEYANGRRVPIDVYASMALRTTATRSYLAGEASMRDEWGMNTVIVNKRGVACPMCLQWVGRVYYDDVWGTVPVTDDKYPRLSTAIQGGLYHPNCKDSHTTYFEGINSEPTPMTKAQEQEAQRVYDLEQRQRYNERMIRKYKRLRDGSLDDENKAYYTQKTEDWQQKNADFIAENGDVLKRRYENEKTRGITGFTKPPVIKPIVVKPPKVIKPPVKVVKPPKVEPPVAKVDEPKIDPYKTKIDSIKDRIAKRGHIEETDIMDAGEEFLNQFDHDEAVQTKITTRNQLASEYTEKNKNLQEAKNRLEEYKKQHAEDLAKLNRYDYDQSFKQFGIEPASKYDEKEIAALRKSVGDGETELESEIDRLYNELKEIGNKRYELTKNDAFENPETIKRILSRIRPMGTAGKDVAGHLMNSRSPLRKTVEQAYNYYPTGWVERSIAKGKLAVKKVSRGFYDDWSELIAISGDAGEDSFKTALHELGHRMEHTIPEIMNAEKNFYERRTNGEAPKWLGHGYGRDEKTKRDHFVHPYMGKDYDGKAFELVSMGFEYGFYDPEYLMQDEDMAKWIYGLLSLI